MRIKKRCYSIDYAKTIAIYLVILGHTYKADTNEWMFIYSFHMPLFFFLSGALYNRDHTLWERINLSFKRIVIPYYWFSFISFALLPLISTLFHTKNASIYSLSKETFLATIGVVYGVFPSLEPVWNTNLWFLPAFFVVQILYAFITKQFPNYIVPIIIVLQFVVPIFAFINFYFPYNRPIFSLDSALMGIFFYQFGYLFKNDLSRHILQRSSDNAVIYIISSIVLSVILLQLIQYMPTNLRFAGGEQGAYPILSYLYAFLGISAVLALSIFFEKTIKNNGLIEFISRNTMSIFALETIVRWNFHRVEQYMNLDFYYIKQSELMYAIIILMMCSIVSFVINRYFPFILSKKEVLLKGA